MNEPVHAPDGAPRRAGIPVRVVEAVVALVFLGLAALVITDSLRLGIDWADDGPRAGYFPFYVGLLMAAASAWNLAQALFALGGRGADMKGAVFAGSAELRPVAAMLLPCIAFVVLIYPLGLYVAAALFLAFFMRARGAFSWLKVGAVSIGLPAALFAMFEVWFLIPLPKGPLEHALGY